MKKLTLNLVGSIGVRTMMPNQDGKMEVIVSSNAPNKGCTGSDCRAKIQAVIDEIETFFVDRMTQYTGWSAEQVISNLLLNSVSGLKYFCISVFSHSLHFISITFLKSSSVNFSLNLAFIKSFVLLPVDLYFVS